MGRECDKLIALKKATFTDVTQEIANFLDHLQERGLELCMWDEEGEEYFASRRTKEQVIADYFNIDLDKIEKEKLAILQDLRDTRAGEEMHGMIYGEA